MSETGEAGRVAAETGPAARTREQRRHPRRKTLLGGMVVYEDNKCTMNCTILDLSESGALVKPGDIMTCPKTFRLKNSRGLDRMCEAVRRAGHSLGVRFV